MARRASPDLRLPMAAPKLSRERGDSTCPEALSDFKFVFVPVAIVDSGSDACCFSKLE